jgi:hypothetical protein
MVQNGICAGSRFKCAKDTSAHHIETLHFCAGVDIMGISYAKQPPLRHCKSMSHNFNQPFCTLHANTDPHQMLHDAKARSPLQFAVVRQQRVCTSKREVGAQAGTFGHIQRIVKCNGAFGRDKDHREEKAVLTFRSPEAVVESMG